MVGQPRSLLRAPRRSWRGNTSGCPTGLFILDSQVVFFEGPCGRWRPNADREGRCREALGLCGNGPQQPQVSSGGQRGRGVKKPCSPKRKPQERPRYIQERRKHASPDFVLVLVGEHEHQGAHKLWCGGTFEARVLFSSRACFSFFSDLGTGTENGTGFKSWPPPTPRASNSEQATLVS